jgi:hypothetical protein
MKKSQIPDLTIKVPNLCLLCDAPYKGGHELPNNKMQKGLRVFYSCGSSLSIKENNQDYCLLLFKGCGTNESNLEK